MSCNYLKIILQQYYQKIRAGITKNSRERKGQQERDKNMKHGQTPRSTIPKITLLDQISAQQDVF